MEEVLTYIYLSR